MTELSVAVHEYDKEDKSLWLKWFYHFHKTLKKVTPKTCPKFEIYLDKAGLYRYRLIASNGESIAMSEEGYKSKNGVMNGINSVSINAVDAEIVDETLEK